MKDVWVTVRKTENGRVEVELETRRLSELFKDYEICKKNDEGVIIQADLNDWNDTKIYFK